MLLVCIDTNSALCLFFLVAYCVFTVMLQTKCALTLRGSRNDKLVSRCRRFNRPDFCRICCFLPFPLLGDVWLPSRSFQSCVLVLEAHFTSFLVA